MALPDATGPPETWQAMGDLVLDNMRRREVSDAPGLSFAKTRALRRIAKQPMSMLRLASLLCVDPRNLTPLADNLEQAHLVERTPHPTDRRVKLEVAVRPGAALANAGRRDSGPSAGLRELSAKDLKDLVLDFGRGPSLPKRS